MTHSTRRHAATVLAVVFLLAVVAASNLSAQGAYVSTERFGYNGTIERYSSLSDLLDGVNAVTGYPFRVPPRDLTLYVVDGNAAFTGDPVFANFTMFFTSWHHNGASPSNQNTGYIQMADFDGGSVSSVEARWLDQSRTVFDFALTGGNTIYGCVTHYDDCGLLWNAGSPLGSNTTMAGIFHSYTLNFTATGLSSAVWNSTTGVYESLSDPTAVSGSLAGIFHNTNPEDPGSNGWYKYNLALTMDNWAIKNGFLGADASVFGSSQVVPEPSTMLILFTGLVGVAGVACRRREDKGEQA